MKLKTIIYTIALLLAATALSSCGDATAQAPEPTPPPDPVKVLEERVESETQLRREAEEKADGEQASRETWELAAISLAVLAVVGFFAGTALGSKGKNHASRI